MRIEAQQELQRLILAGQPIPEGLVAKAKPQTVTLPRTQQLGDKVASALAAIGITEDRYIAVKEAFGLPPTCGCSSRKAWLNKVSQWWSESSNQQEQTI